MRQFHYTLEAGLYFVAQAGLELSDLPILLPQAASAGITGVCCCAGYPIILITVWKSFLKFGSYVLKTAEAVFATDGNDLW